MLKTASHYHDHEPQQPGAIPTLRCIYPPLHNSRGEQVNGYDKKEDKALNFHKTNGKNEGKKGASASLHPDNRKIQQNFSFFYEAGGHLVQDPDILFGYVNHPLDHADPAMKGDLC
ncbi:MAG: hypothetical protein OXC07_04095 [Kistimonas sp.]|nr:hypothetical protein [Kistimonas sp.]